MRPFLAFSKIASIIPCKGDKKKFLKIPAYSGLRGFVRNEGKFPQINVHFSFCWFVGIGEKFSAVLAKSLRVALKVLKEKVLPERNKPAANRRIISEQTTERSFLEQDSTTVPNFAYRLILSYGNLVGVATPSPPFCGPSRLKKSTHERRSWK